MSYILEALKRSQRERELGKVPNLAMASADSTEQKGGMNRLLLVALLLAILSMLIALYAALGGRFTAQGVTDQPTRVSPPLTPARPAVAPPPPSAAIDTPIQTTVRSPVPTQNGSEQNRPETKTGERLQQNNATVPPPPSTPMPAALTPPPETEPTGQVADARRPTADDLRKELLEVRRMLEQKKVPPAPPAKRPPLTVEPVPLSMEGAGETANRSPVPGNAAGTDHLPGLAQTLPEALRRRLPNRQLSVLSYAKDPEMRFVILNSEKINEGETSRDGLTLVTIRPEGAVLSFEGHLFFQPL